MQRCLNLLLMMIGCSHLPAQLVINEFQAINNSTLADAQGDFSDWIELYNTGSNTVDLTGWFLTDTETNLTRWTFPSVSLATNAYMLVFASDKNTNINNQLHTNFRLDGDGEYLALVNAQTNIVFEYAPAYPSQLEDLTYGVDTNLAPRYFATPTPLGPNADDFLGLVEDTKFSVDRGIFTNSFMLAITSATASATIRYTLDSSEPTETTGILYTGPFLMDDTRVVRAAAYKVGYHATDIDTHSYLFIHNVINFTNAPAGYPSTWRNAAGTDHQNSANYTMDASIVTNPVYRVQMTNALMSHPIVSIAMDQEEWFNQQTGIYANSQAKGDQWERAISAEFLFFPNAPDTQANCGIRIFGNASRAPSRPKHNMRLVFRSEYGPGKFDFPAFRGGGRPPINGYLMRGQNGDSWIHPTGNQRTDAVYLRDQFARDLCVAMGQPVPAQDHVHLFLNGMYWGFFHTIERIEADWAESWFGGDADNWDIIKARATANAVDVEDGNQLAYRAMHDLAEAGITNDTQYAAIESYIDIENFIDYMLVNYYNGNSDWDNNNWQAARDRTKTKGFKFFVHDSERTMLAADVNRTGLNNIYMPTRLHQRLKGHPEYLLRFADHIQEHFFNGGVLTPERTAALFNQRVDEIRPGLLGEAARWGDYHRPGNPYLPNREWETKVTALNAGYFPVRSATVFTQLRNADLYPSIDAPVLSQHGGTFERTLDLSIASSTNVYYTLDGSDPREALTGQIQGTVYSGNLPLNFSTRIMARAFDGTEWSALTEATFYRSDETPLRFSELMVTPRQPGPGEAGFDASDFEFIELENAGTNATSLIGARITGGIDFDLGNSGLAPLLPGERILLVKNQTAFALRYPGVPVLGTYTGSLNDQGESLHLEIETLGRVISFAYNDGRNFPLAAQGAGHSLVPAFTGQTEGALDYGGHWRASTFRDGSPGLANPAPQPTLVLNEIGTHTDNTNPAFPQYDSNDWIEIYNTSANSQVLTHWYLSDDAEQLDKWRLGPAFLIPGKGLLNYDEIGGFNAPGEPFGFGLNKAGETVFLSYLPGTDQDRIGDAIRLKGQENGTTHGRYHDGSGRWQTLLPTRGAANLRGAQDLVIHELMYHAPGGDELNYVVVHNPTAQAVPLFNAAGGWRLTGELEFVFAQSLAADASAIIVPFDPADTLARTHFEASYGFTGGTLLGPWTGNLSHSGGRIALERPQEADAPSTNASWVVVDETWYFDQAPWPQLADGSGYALHRLDPRIAGPIETNWVAANPSPDSPSILAGPLIENAPATAISSDRAIMNGLLLTNGQSTAQIYVYWGTNDGLSVTADWEHISLLGTQSEGLLPVMQIGLKPNTTYFYRFFAENGASATWASPSASFTTPNPFDVQASSLRICFSGYDRAQSLTNFPALLRLGEHLPGFFYGTFASGQGHDLRILTEDLSTELAFEIEHWDTNGTSAVWVKVPDFTSNTCVIATWGDEAAAAAGLPASSTDGSVWDPGYHMVMHLADDTLDSTSNGYNGINVGTSDGAGLISGGQVMGNGTYLAIDQLLFLQPAAIPEIMVSGWVKTSVAANQMFVSFDRSEYFRFAVRDDSAPLTVGWDTEPATGALSDSRSPGSVTDGQWHYLVGWFKTASAPTFDKKIYIDGVPVTELNAHNGVAVGNGSVRAGFIGVGSEATSINGTIGPTSYLQGTIDEVRMARVAQSDDWIWAEYQNQRADSTLAMYDTVISENPDSDGDFILDAWELAVFTNLTTASAITDFDLDGFPDLAEFFAGTNPRDSHSLLVLELKVTDQGAQTELMWFSESNRWYRVSRKGALQDAWVDIAPAVQATPPLNLLLDTPPAPRAYYRVEVLSP
ncbi:MAG: hypothetical protein ACI9QL_002835 [Candidatus Omnitrophota bacterium]|jgi:hypothetical protein